MLSSENSKFLSFQQQSRQQSEQQLDKLLHKQREIDKQQRDELLELREFRKKYEQPSLFTKGNGEIELMRIGLRSMKFPANKQNIMHMLSRTGQK